LRRIRDGARLRKRIRRREEFMWRETIETGTFARCHFCSEIIIAEQTPPSADRCWCGKRVVDTQPMNDNYFDEVMRVRRPSRRTARRRPGA